jgi:hypothetical protein
MKTVGVLVLILIAVVLAACEGQRLAHVIRRMRIATHGRDGRCKINETSPKMLYAIEPWCAGERVLCGLGIFRSMNELVSGNRG